MENVNKNLFYKSFDPIEARRKVDEHFLEIEKIKAHKNEKLSGVEYAIEMLGISKSFNSGKIVANDEIDLLIAKNEIHAIIGENGAGKSTLMSILFGIYEPDSGIIKINGKEVQLESAKDAAKYKIGMVHQHFKLVPTYTVYENIVLGSEEVSTLGILSTQKSKRKLTELINRYNLQIRLTDKIENLTVSDQQKVEILKALYRDSEILIFDEPTAVLSPFEIESFLKIVKLLQSQNKTIIIITHKLEEIKSVANRGTIIREGRFIEAFNIQDKSVTEIAEAMVGKKLDVISNKNHNIGQSVILNVQNLNIAGLLSKDKNSGKPLNFKIHQGEIFAVAGVDGNGQKELALALSGLKNISGSRIGFAGKDITNYSVNQRYRAGLSHVPEDRQKSGLILDMPCCTNAVSNRIDEEPFSNFGFINEQKIEMYAKKLIKKYDVRGTTGGTTNARSLSGGNQQKLIVGRELTNNHKLIIMVQPTRGLDLGAIEYIHARILEEKQKGNAVLLISYELSEILALADTVAVMNKGMFVDISPIGNTSRQKIGELMLGKTVGQTTQTQERSK